MKKFLNLLTAISILSLVVFISCGGDDGDGDGGTDPVLSPEAEQAALLVAGGASWTLNAGSGSVTVDGVNSEDWANFSLTFTGDENGGSFSTSNSASPLVWPASGTWDFNNSTTSILRNDGVVMTINVTETQLTLSFTIEEEGSGRIQGFGGSWVFNLGN